MRGPSPDSTKMENCPAAATQGSICLTIVEEGTHSSVRERRPSIANMPWPAQTWASSIDISIMVGIKVVARNDTVVPLAFVSKSSATEDSIRRRVVAAGIRPNGDGFSVDIVLPVIRYMESRCFSRDRCRLRNLVCDQCFASLRRTWNRNQDTCLGTIGWNLIEV